MGRELKTLITKTESVFRAWQAATAIRFGFGEKLLCEKYWRNGLEREIIMRNISLVAWWCENYATFVMSILIGAHCGEENNGIEHIFLEFDLRPCRAFRLTEILQRSNIFAECPWDPMKENRAQDAMTRNGTYGGQQMCWLFFGQLLNRSYKTAPWHLTMD